MNEQDELIEDISVKLIRILYPNILPPAYVYKMTVNDLLLAVDDQLKEYKEKAWMYDEVSK